MFLKKHVFLKIPCFPKYVFLKNPCFLKYVFLKNPCFLKYVFFKGPCFQKTRIFQKMFVFLYYKLLQKFALTIVPQVKRELDFYQRPPEEKPYILQDPPSLLIAEPGTPVHSIPIVSELDVFLPTFPSSPRTESYYSRSESY